MNLPRLLARASAPLALLLLLLAVAACSNPGRDALDRASAVIDEHPDSAYAILAAVDPATLRNEADSALYALRWTQALYHTDREDSIVADTVLCDRLIPYAAAHYDMQPPSREHAQAFYYAGVVADMMNDNGVAIHYFQNARDACEATDTPDPILAGRIYRELGNSYGAILDDTLALKYEYLAREILVRADSAAYYRTAMYDIGRTLFHLGRTEEAIAALDSIIDPADTGSPLICSAMSLKARALTIQQRYAEALPIFGTISSAASYRMDLDDWEAMGTCHAFMSQTTMAEACAVKAREINPGSALVDHALAIVRGDYRKAYDCNVSQMLAQGEYMRQLQRTLAYERTDALGQLSRLRREKAADEARGRSRTLAVCLALTAVLAAALIVRMRRRSRRILAQRLRELTRLRDQLEAATRQGAAAGEVPRDNLEVMRSILADIMKVYGEDMERTGVGDAEKTRRHIVAVATEYFRSDGFMATMFSGADNANGNIIARLRAEVPGLTRRNLLLAATLLNGFSPEQAATILGIAVRSVYTGKSRLIRKLEEADIPSAAEAASLLRDTGRPTPEHAAADRR